MMKKKKKQDENFRVKQFFIQKDNLMYDFFLNEMHLSKNLYNATLYELRHAFFNKTIIKSLDKVMKSKVFNGKVGFDYYNMATVQSAQQTMGQVRENITSFFSSLRKYKKNPANYTGRPKLPKYKKKDGYYTVTLTNQNCKVKGYTVSFPGNYNGFTLNIKSCFEDSEYDFKSLSEVRYKLLHKTILMEVVYKVTPKKVYKHRKDKICGVDLGVGIFAACSFNFKENPILIDGKKVKEINQLYNKKISEAKSIADTNNNLYNTKKIDALWMKRYRKIKDYMHKASSFLVKRCLELGVSKIIIGENKGWKQEKKNMQNFTFIPYNMFKNMVEYKANFYGIKVIFIKESYTSGTSFLDNEKPMKKYYNKSRRLFRGLFKSNQNVLIQADVNAAYQIIKMYEIKENKTRVGKNLITCFNSSINWKKVASNAERKLLYTQL